ncbi:cadherin-like beta sandwich domain-containing protein [Mucilaginibacter pedocola]|uniref:Cadherin-like beta-sandwich-like domain-containing protein n=1 Tax=Mucilaginibacter pedocola TaxID=1792845 RepID=A0A1S9P7X5_9SPHI|nr:cadherin-like beta sandwich domain-containing protein [Mucilaginibacter pedocola]OOQ57039.1 hypothetical protein BC343_16010 [Mucilaginibacter pedocola]
MKKVLLLLILTCYTFSLLAQAPKISYSTTPVFTAGVAISPLQPTNTGGAVPANVYAQTSAISDSTGIYNSTGAKTQPTGLKNLNGITVDAQGNIYVGRYQPTFVSKITPQGTTSTFGGTWPANTYSAPGRMCADNAGYVYLADRTDGHVKKINPAGIVTFIGDTVSRPGGIAVDKNGNIYVSEPGLSRIRKITAAGQTTLFAGTSGVPGSTDGPAISAKFIEPTALTIDNAGNLYVVDSYVVRKISVTGQVTTLAGKLYSWASADGRDTSASFREPAGITVDAAGNVYVAEPYAIRRISPDGYVSTIAGKPYNGGVTNGVGSAAGFWYLNDLVFDGTGNLYTAERQAVRKVSLTGYAIDKPLPAGLVFDAKTGIISGKPTGTFPVATYKITAYNLAGESSATVTLRCISSDPRLSNLTFSIGTLSPAYTSGNITYQSSVPVGTASIMVTPVLFDSTATIKINGVVARNGQPNAVAIVAGDNTVAVTVLASDGVATRTYSVKVNRPSSSEVQVTSIDLSSDYVRRDGAGINWIVDGPVSGIRIKISTTTNTTIKINGTTGVGGAFSGLIALNYGINTFPVEVISENGVNKEAFTITITRGSSSTEVQDFFMTPGTLTRESTHYPTPPSDKWFATVPADMTSIRLKAAANANVTIKAGDLVIPQNAWSEEVPLHMGVNQFSVEVTAEDRVTKRAYSIRIARGSPYVSPGTITTDLVSLKPMEYSYQNLLAGALPTADKPIRVLATLSAETPNATIQINGVAVANNTYSAPITLKDRDNRISVEYTSENGESSISYTVLIGVGSTDTSFTAMELYASGAVPLNRVGITDTWTATVNSATEKVMLEMFKNNYEIDFFAQDRDFSSYIALNPLNYGLNDIVVKIRAPNKVTTRNIHLLITRTPTSTDADLSSIALTDPVAVLKATNGSVNRYTATVANTTTSIKVLAKTQNPRSWLSVNGAFQFGNVASEPIPLVPGDNIIRVDVRTEDGTLTQAYIINVTRAASAVATLSKLYLVEPAVTKTNTSTGPGDYNSTALVKATTKSIKVVAVAADPNATITVNGVVTASGAVSAPITLTGGDAQITVEVTAANGITIKRYVIKVRPPAAIATLSKLYLVEPAVAKTNTATGPGDYNSTALVKATTKSIKVVAVATDPNATITVNGVVTASGVVSAPVALAGGAGTITVQVTAENGTTIKRYVIAVKPPSAIATLAKLYLVEPAVAKTNVNSGPAEYNSTASVSATTKTIKVVAVATDTTATIRINGVVTGSGAVSAPISLNVGQNTINIVVTAQDGTTTHSWAIIVAKPASRFVNAISGADNEVGIIQKNEPVSEALQEGIIVNQAVSPNGDGINDRFNIEGITAFPENIVRVINRTGEVVYEAKGYDNQGIAFDGHNSKGAMQQPGTYFYSVEYKKGNQTIKKTGYLVLKY